MTKRIALFLFLAISIFTLNAAAQTTSVKGAVKDDDGKLLVGATIELLNNETGRNFTVKTDSRGQYSTMGLPVGNNYKITITAADGKTVLWYVNGVPMRPGPENTYDFDLAKERAAAAKASGVTDEQRKKIEEAKKSNEKIKGLNALLLQATAQKKDGKFDDAVATLQQAVAQDQTHDVIYASLADAYISVKNYPEAEAAFTKALELAPPTSKSLGNYHAGLSLAFLQQGKTEPGMAECDKTAQADPAQAGQCYFNEGAILTNQGKIDDANQAFDKAIVADPTKAEAYYQKGVNLLARATLGKDGKMVPAPGTVEALNKYLEIAPDGKNAQAAKDLLDSLGAAVQTSYGTKKPGKK
jgi:tetratricopeptide (TPR) repeat protein